MKISEDAEDEKDDTGRSLCDEGPLHKPKNDAKNFRKPSSRR